MDNRQDTQNFLIPPQTLPDSICVDDLVTIEKSAEMTIRSASTSMVAFSSQPEKAQDDNSIANFSSSEISDVHFFHHESQAPIHLQKQSNHTRAEGGTTTQDDEPIVKAMTMAQQKLRAAEKARSNLVARCRLEKQRTGKQPKLRGERRQIQLELDHCRATITFLSLNASSDVQDRASSGSGGTHAKLRATTLLKVASDKANAQVKARNAFKSPSGAGLGSSTWNEEFRANTLKSRWSHIPKVPAKLDQAAAKALLGKHGMDAEEAMMEIEAFLPTASVTPPKRKTWNRNRITKKPVGGSSKANPIAID